MTGFFFHLAFALATMTMTCLSADATAGPDLYRTADLSPAAGQHSGIDQ